MTNLLFLIFFVFSITACKGGQTSEKFSVEADKYFWGDSVVFDKEIITPGLLRVKTDVLEQQGAVLRITLNKLLIDSLSANNNSEPSFSRNDINIWSYFPDYYIVIFESFPIENDGFYRVIVDGDLYKIPHLEGITIFETWPEHLNTSFILTKKGNPLRVDPDKNADAFLFDYDELSFEVMEVRGDWIYVKCCYDCEGCPEMEIRGWLKWMENNFLKVELRYFL